MKISADQHQEIIELRKAGLSLQAIANKYGVTREAIRKIVEKDEAAKATINIQRQRTQEILSDFRAGMTPKEIIAKYDLNESTFYTIIYRYDERVNKAGFHDSDSKTEVQSGKEPGPSSFLNTGFVDNKSLEGEPLEPEQAKGTEQQSASDLMVENTRLKEEIKCLEAQVQQFYIGLNLTLEVFDKQQEFIEDQMESAREMYKSSDTKLYNFWSGRLQGVALSKTLIKQVLQDYHAQAGKVTTNDKD